MSEEVRQRDVLEGTVHESSDFESRRGALDSGRHFDGGQEEKKAGGASKTGHLIYINLLQHAPRADVDGTGFGGNGLPRRVYLALLGLDAGRQVNTHFRCQIIL